MNRILSGIRDRMGDVNNRLSKAEEAHAAGHRKEAADHLIAASNSLTMVAIAVEGLREAVGVAAYTSSGEETAGGPDRG